MRIYDVVARTLAMIAGLIFCCAMMRDIANGVDSRMDLLLCLVCAQIAGRK